MAPGPTSTSSRWARHCNPGTTTRNSSPIATDASPQCCRRTMRHSRRCPGPPDRPASTHRKFPGCARYWPTEKHFTAWTGLAPGSSDSGKRRKGVKRGRNRTGQLFCMMAQSLVRSRDIALGGFYRRLAARRGGLVATKALARKLAAWFWRVMVKGDDYVEKGLARYEEQVRKTREQALRRLAKELGRELVPVPVVSQTA